MKLDRVMALHPSFYQIYTKNEIESIENYLEDPNESYSFKLRLLQRLKV